MVSSKKGKGANRLAQELSPYLQQHASNPVDWYPWGDEAFRRAERENKPVFLSVGYAACHWCHVMERESFEDEETAAILNEGFVSIKVDREERPDIDSLYMGAVQVMTHHGGWPMSVFLTPKAEPFYGGTYFPPEDRMGMPSFKKVLLGVSGAWKQRRGEVMESAKQMVLALEQLQSAAQTTSSKEPGLGWVAAALSGLQGTLDLTEGGFGQAPKFFHSSALKLMLRTGTRTGDEELKGFVTKSLTKMAYGGVYDQLGGGFHRYSTDPKWLVPHFEKMLYDNGLLADLYVEAYRATKNDEFARIAHETLDYVLRDMVSPTGGFYSTQDADTEGQEGKFFVWSKEEIRQSLDEELGSLFCRFYGVSESGNWEGHSILTRSVDVVDFAKAENLDPAWVAEALATAKRKLLQRRAGRVAPFRDEKILVGWNGLMIEALARGSKILDEPAYLLAAVKAGDFLIQKMKVPGEKGRVSRVYRDGKIRVAGCLEDYSYVTQAFLTLFEVTGEARWMIEAKEFLETMVSFFWDPGTATFYLSPTDESRLLVRPREAHDGATPSPAAVALLSMVRYGKLSGDFRYAKLVEQGLAAQEELFHRAPLGAGEYGLVLEMLLGDSKEIVIVPGDDEKEFEKVTSLAWQCYFPNATLHAGKPNPALGDKTSVDGKTTLYLCENQSCREPWVGYDIIAEKLKETAGTNLLFS